MKTKPIRIANCPTLSITTTAVVTRFSHIINSSSSSSDQVGPTWTVCVFVIVCLLAYSTTLNPAAQGYLSGFWTWGIFGCKQHLGSPPFSFPPLSLPPHTSPPLSPPTFPLPTFSPPLEVGPLNPGRGSGSAVNSMTGSGPSPSRIWIWCI